MRINYFLALFFGLIHGMGFANTIRMVLASDQSLGWSLFGFNVGLEVGQIVVVLALLVRGTTGTAVPGSAPRLGFVPVGGRFWYFVFNRIGKNSLI